jgi:hypothetical protein
VENTLWVYRQRASGFEAMPDQAIVLPPQTAWIALCSVDAHPGVELVLSTAGGLFYLRQNNGVFESLPRTLVAAAQVFTNANSPRLIRFDGPQNQANAQLPVISAGQAVWYERKDGWNPGPPLPLHLDAASWREEQGGWMMGGNPSHTLQVRQDFRLRKNPDLRAARKAEDEHVSKMVEEPAKPGRAWTSGIQRIDVNGDGREDLVLWRIVGDLEPRTDVMLFLRGTDGQLPERPTQVLHCRGFPIPVGPGGALSPVCDLDGDGVGELVLVALKTTVTSWSSVVEMLLTKGVDCVLTVRTFRKGAFSRSADASIGVTTMVPSEETGMHEFFLIEGDFNGDGRRDVLIQRSLTQWEILLSTTGAGWFAPAARLAFEAPADSSFQIQDLNGDGLSDIVAQVPGEPRLLILLSEPAQPHTR